jgi:hypothetical protein
MSPELSLMTRFYPLGMLATLTQSVYGGLAERRALIKDLRFAPAWMHPIFRELAGAGR